MGHHALQLFFPGNAQNIAPRHITQVGLNCRWDKTGRLRLVAEVGNELFIVRWPFDADLGYGHVILPWCLIFSGHVTL
jgi:hypothetical protein